MGQKYKGFRVVIVFECRDAAGKGGTIKAITERVSPRVFPIAALPAAVGPAVHDAFPGFPAVGEIVIFDRSWYNRAGVEHVMRFCAEEQHGTCLRFVLRRTNDDRERYRPGQILAGGERGGAGAPLRGAH